MHDGTPDDGCKDLVVCDVRQVNHMVSSLAWLLHYGRFGDREERLSMKRYVKVLFLSILSSCFS